MPNPPALDEDAVDRADKEMEERANRAKALLSNRYKGLKTAQVSTTRQQNRQYDERTQSSSSSR